MSKYILTLLVCLSSHTLAATDHTQKARSLTTEKKASSSEALHKETSTNGQKGSHPSFWKNFFRYFGLTLGGAVSLLVSVTLIDIVEPIGSLGIALLLSGGIAFTAAYFYTKYQAHKPSLFKCALAFFGWEVIGYLATFLGSFLMDKNNNLFVLAIFVPTGMTLLLCAIGALMYVFYFNYPHEGDRNQTADGTQSFWKNFFGYFMLTLPGACTMLCSSGWLVPKTNNLSEIIDFDNWDTVAIMISVSGLLISLGIAFFAAYFYTKSHKTYKHSLKKHTAGFFALCVNGYLATLFFFLIAYLLDDYDFEEWVILLLAECLPSIVISLSICGISAKMYVRYFKKLQQKKEEEKQMTKSAT